jgi:hypothetical protein
MGEPVDCAYQLEGRIEAQEGFEQILFVAHPSDSRRRPRFAAVDAVGHRAGQHLDSERCGLRADVAKVVVARASGGIVGPENDVRRIEL